MRGGPRILVAAACAMVMGLLNVPHAGRAQEDAGREGGPAYNPYPPDILPDDLRSEMRRVQREVRGIFKQALEEWRALPPLTPAGNPPTFQDTGYEAVRILGKLLNFDENMSVEKDQACSFCHMPYAAFSGPIPSVNLTTIANPGSFDFRFGKRTPPAFRGQVPAAI